MPRKRNQISTYRLHSQSGQAVSDFYDPVTGRFDSTESRREHARIVAEVAAGRTAGPTDGITLNELFMAFLRHAEQHYRRPDGSPTREVNHFKQALRGHANLTFTPRPPSSARSLRRPSASGCWRWDGAGDR